MSLKFKEALRVFVFAESVDLRAGFDKLTHLVEVKMKSRLVDGDLFLFLGKSRKKLKAICYDGTGVVLISKRLERGRFMSLLDLEEREITVEELDVLLRGGIIRRAVFGKMPQSLLTDLPQGVQNYFQDGAT